MRYWLPYIFLLTVFTEGRAYSVSGDSLPEKLMADSLSAAGEHYLAALYYQKAAYFSEDAGSHTLFTLQASDELKQIGLYNDAEKLLERINTGPLDEEQVFRVKNQLALLCYLSGNFAGAENHLVQSEYLLSDSALIYGNYMLYALVLHEQFRWKEAAAKIARLERYMYSEPDTAYTRINEHYAAANKIRLRKKEKAIKMSTYFPGLGQTYAGYPGEGLVSFGSLLGTTAVMAFGIFHQYYFTSVVLGNVIIGKFYQGNLSRTEFLTEKRNYLLTKDYNEQLKQSLLLRYGTKKTRL
jgi:TM2 domain-containing membrane protein YozV